MFPPESHDARTVKSEAARTDLLPKVSGKLACASPASLRELEHVTLAFARRLRRDFAQDISRDSRGFKKQVLRLIRRLLPPRRGRPINPKTEAALALWHQGKTVREILRLQIRDFDRLDTWGRMLAEKALRQALVRQRKRN